jgi:hypothetical protein
MMGAVEAVFAMLAVALGITIQIIVSKKAGSAAISTVYGKLPVCRRKVRFNEFDPSHVNLKFTT